MKRLTLLVVTLVLGACGPAYTDIYLPCELDAASTDPAESACATGERATCALTASRSDCVGGPDGPALCARYEGSEPFCSKSCSTDADCVGFCQRELNFCVSRGIEASVR